MACSISNTEFSSTNPQKKKTQALHDKCRADTALAALTRRFMELVKRSQDGCLDLNVASLQLNVSKRRIYDVINVLEGICLLKKKSKNYVEWAGGQENVSKGADLTTLVQEEEKLDQLIEYSRRQLKRLFRDHTKRFVYLTYEDVKNIPCLKEQTVIVIKAPAETEVDVPHPQKSLQVHLRSTLGPIEVFVCSDDMIPEDCGCLTNAPTDEDDFIHPVPYSSTVQVSRAVSQPGCSWKEMLCCLIEEGNKTTFATIPDSVVLPSFSLSQCNTHRLQASPPPPPTAHF